MSKILMKATEETLKTNARSRCLVERNQGYRGRIYVASRSNAFWWSYVQMVYIIYCCSLTLLPSPCSGMHVGRVIYFERSVMGKRRLQLPVD